MRRLPVIQPTAFERRAFLLGIVAAVAGCASESGTTPRRGTTGGGGGGGATAPKDGGTSSGGDGGTEVDPPDDAGGNPPTDSGADGGPPPACAVAGVEGGTPNSYAMGTLTYVAAAGAYVGRDAGGLYAMYALCTHTIGNLSVGATELTCLVHGARFSLTGAVLQGPATMPLPHFEICLKGNGNIAINSKVIVASTTRLAV